MTLAQLIDELQGMRVAHGGDITVKVDVGTAYTGIDGVEEQEGLDDMGRPVVSEISIKGLPKVRFP